MATEKDTAIQDKPKMFYGWIIVIAATLIYTISEIPIFTFSIFVKPIASEMGYAREVITNAISLYFIFLGVFSILGGILVDRLGPRILNFVGTILIGSGLIVCSQAGSSMIFYLGFSAMGGIGFSFIFVPNQTTLARWFVAKKGLAIGIMFAGGGIGALIASYFLQMCIERSGWRTAFIILGVFVLCIPVLASLFLRKDPKEMGLSPLGAEEGAPGGPPADKGSGSGGPVIQSQDLTLAEAVKTRAFWQYNLAVTCIFYGFFMVSVNLAPHLTDMGLTAAAAAVGVGITNGFNAFGRLFMGWVSDKIGTKRTFFICLILGAIMVFCLIPINAIWMMCIFAVFFGTAFGGTVPQMPRLLSELFGLKYLGAIMGVGTLITTIGPALGPKVGSKIFGITGSYSIAFMTGSIAIIIALCLIFVLKAPQKKE